MACRCADVVQCAAFAQRQWSQNTVSPDTEWRWGFFVLFFFPFLDQHKTNCTPMTHQDKKHGGVLQPENPWTPQGQIRQGHLDRPSWCTWKHVAHTHTVCPLTRLHNLYNGCVKISLLFLPDRTLQPISEQCFWSEGKNMCAQTHTEPISKMFLFGMNRIDVPCSWSAVYKVYYNL